MAAVDKLCKDRKFAVLYKKVLRSQEIEDSMGWWNGVAVMVIGKNEYGIGQTPVHLEADYDKAIPET
jgi:hypothetical protein